MASTTAARTDAADESGVLFPVVDGRRSTSRTSRAVFAEATRAVAPDVAQAIESSRQWHREYVARLADVEAASAESAKASLSIARDGLDALHQHLVFARNGKEVVLAEALRTWSGTPYSTETVTGEGTHPGRLELPYRGRLLAGDELRRQLDAWVERGIVEPGFAEALRLVDSHPDWLDARDLTVVLVGAAAEMGPIEALSRWGANVVAVDIASPRVWQRILTAARAGSGQLQVPVAAEDVDTSDLAGAAGADLLTQLPDVRAWLDTFGGPLVLGNYAYADGASFVRVAAAADRLLADVCDARPDSALAYLASPTDVFAVPMSIIDATRSGRLDGPRGRWIGGPLRAVSAGRLFTPNYRRIVDGEDGRFGLADSVVPQQGPNYALAKRLQRWRALLSRESVVTSANVAPATRTKSVTKNRVLAAAYSGASSFGIEIFDVATSSTLMAAKLVHDLRNSSSTSHPSTPIDHPLGLFVDGAAHGGLWRLPWEPRSVLPLAAVEGLVKRR